MGLDLYQIEARLVSTHLFEPSRDTIEYAALAIAGEAGELANMAKKVWRENGHVGGNIPADKLAAMVLELGDILWYVAHAAGVLGVPLSFVADQNIAKLEARNAKAAADA